MTIKKYGDDPRQYTTVTPTDGGHLVTIHIKGELDVNGGVFESEAEAIGEAKRLGACDWIQMQKDDDRAMRAGYRRGGW